MANECLVTKLKGTVDATLPRFNTLVFGIESVQTISNFYVATGDEPVHIKAYVECHDGNSSGPVITETDCAANRSTAIVFPANVEAAKALEISGPGIYKLRSLMAQNVNLIQSNIVGHPESSIESMKFASGLICFGGVFAPADVVPASVKYFAQIENYQPLPPNVEILNSFSPTTKVVRLSDVKNNIYLKGAYFNRFEGVITDLPVNMEYFAAGNSGSLTGSIEDMVVSFRQRGRQTGYIAIPYGLYSIGITYNGRTITDYYNDGLLSHFTIGTGPVVIFGWDANGNITVEESIPQELQRYTTIVNPYNYLQQYNA